MPVMVGSALGAVGVAPGVAEGAPCEPAGRLDGGAAPNPTSGPLICRGASGGGAPAGRTNASICAFVSFIR